MKGGKKGFVVAAAVCVCAGANASDRYQARDMRYDWR